MWVPVGCCAASAKWLRVEYCAIAHGVPAGPINHNSLVAPHLEHPSLKRRVGGANPPEAASFSPRSPTAETTVSEAVQCRCNSCRGHHFRLRSSVERVADYESAGRRCKSCRRHHFNAPVAQCTERRASNAEVGGESPSGSAISNKERQPDQRAGTRC